MDAASAHRPIPDHMGLKALVVDDNPTCLKIFSTMLAALHFLVQPFKSAAEAFCALRQQKEEIDLVLIEVHIGETVTAAAHDSIARLLTSFCLIDHIVKETHITVITMCADDDQKMLCKSLSHGASFHFTKPMTPAIVEVMRQKAWQKLRANCSSDILMISTGKQQANNNKEREEEATAGFNNAAAAEAAEGKMRKKLGLGFYGVVGPRRSIQMTDNFNYHQLDASAAGKGKYPMSTKPQRTTTSGRLLWDLDLHQRFLTSMELLGQHAVPRKILELMNVDGLTVKQVSSHLQKHRRRQDRTTKKAVLLRQLLPKPLHPPPPQTTTTTTQSTVPKKQRKIMKSIKMAPLRPLLPKPLPSSSSAAAASAMPINLHYPPLIPCFFQLNSNPISTTAANAPIFLNSSNQMKQEHGGGGGGSQNNIVLLNYSCVGIDQHPDQQQYMLLDNTNLSVGKSQLPNFADPAAIINWGSSSSSYYHQLPVEVVDSSSSNDSTKVLASSSDNFESSGSDRGSSTVRLLLNNEQVQEDVDSLCLDRALREAFNITSDDSSPDDYITLTQFLGLDQPAGGADLQKEVIDENSCEELEEEDMLDDDLKEPIRRRSPTMQGLQAPQNMDDSAVPEEVLMQRKNEPQSSSQMGEAAKNIIINENSDDDSFDIENFSFDEDLVVEIFEEINISKTRAPW